MAFSFFDQKNKQHIDKPLITEQELRDDTSPSALTLSGGETGCKSCLRARLLPAASLDHQFTCLSTYRGTQKEEILV